MADIVWTWRHSLTSELGTDFTLNAVATGGEGSIYETPTCAASATTVVDIETTIAEIKGYMFLSDKNCTIHLNSTGGTAIPLVANVPVFYEAGLNTNLIDTDITTGLHIVVGAVGTAQVKIHILRDAQT